MNETILFVRNFIESSGFGPLSIAVSAVLGTLSVLTASCCALPIVGALAGYSVARSKNRRAVWLTAIMFMVGVVGALLAIGSLFVFAGQTIPRVSGVYWKVAAGIASIAFGIGALELFPFKIPGVDFSPIRRKANTLGPAVSGLVFGGALALSSLCCNPGIFIILGAAVLQKHAFWALCSLTAYAIGFSAPLALLVLGLSAGKSRVGLQKVEKIVRMSAGVFLILIGLYFFYTL